jgi:GTP-binding protein
VFYDKVKITVRSGNGGNGSVSFRREKFIPNGGPDGGDGGRGGSVLICADARKNTLNDFRYKKKFAASDGEGGGKNNRSGKDADDVVITVPPGTVIRDAKTGDLVADLTVDGDDIVVARGGRGGFGNARYKNSVRQAPKFARAGRSGEEQELWLELKLIADVALVGYPNAGKSTLLSVLSAAKPKIASYPFTTLVPILGVVESDDLTAVVADIPGLIEGAAEGAGMGTDFLRHIERTKMLLHVVDAAGVDGRDPYDDYVSINRELKLYRPELAERLQWVVLNKADIANVEDIALLRRKIEGEGRKVLAVSGATTEGIAQLKRELVRTAANLPSTVLFSRPGERKVYRFRPEEKYLIEEGPYGLEITGNWIRELVESTNFSDMESVRHFEKQIRRHGLYDELIARGVEHGDTVVLCGSHFEWDID